jgi:hypothetical protein
MEVFLNFRKIPSDNLVVPVANCIGRQVVAGVSTADQIHRLEEILVNCGENSEKEDSEACHG